MTTVLFRFDVDAAPRDGARGHQDDRGNQRLLDEPRRRPGGGRRDAQARDSRSRHVPFDLRLEQSDRTHRRLADRDLPAALGRHDRSAGTSSPARTARPCDFRHDGFDDDEETGESPSPGARSWCNSRSTSRSASQPSRVRLARVPVDVQTEITIDRPRLDVASFAARSRQRDRVVREHQKRRMEDRETALRRHAGRVRRHFLGRDLAYTYEVTELVPGERVVMRTAEGPFPMETTYTWQDGPHGSTRMTLRNRGEPTGFSKLAAPIMRPGDAARKPQRPDAAQGASRVDPSVGFASRRRSTKSTDSISPRPTSSQAQKQPPSRPLLHSRVLVACSCPRIDDPSARPNG